VSETLFDTQEGVVITRRGRGGQIDEEDARLVRLSALLTMADFPFQHGDFPVDPPALWTRERCIAAGTWVMGVLAEAQSAEERAAGHRPRLVRDHMERLYTLGLGPGRFVLNQLFGNFGAYGDAAEVRTGRDNRPYENWSIAQYVEHAASLARRLGRKPREPDYTHAHERGKGPNARQIIERVGGIRALNEYIGYPNIHDWTLDDYVNWGARVARANKGGALTARLLGHLSKAKRGPSASIIQQKFGGLGPFQDQAMQRAQEVEATEAAHQKDLLQLYERLHAAGVGAARGLPQIRTRLLYAAKYTVASELLPPVTLRSFPYLLRTPTPLFLATLRDLRPSLSTVDIEATAKNLGVFDDLWPMDEWRDYLHVPLEVLGYVRSGNQSRFAADQAG